MLIRLILKQWLGPLLQGFEEALDHSNTMSTVLLRKTTLILHPSHTFYNIDLSRVRAAGFEGPSEDQKTCTSHYREITQGGYQHCNVCHSSKDVLIWGNLILACSDEGLTLETSAMVYCIMHKHLIYTTRWIEHQTTQQAVWIVNHNLNSTIPFLGRFWILMACVL